MRNTWKSLSTKFQKKIETPSFWQKINQNQKITPNEWLNFKIDSRKIFRSQTNQTFKNLGKKKKDRTQINKKITFERKSNLIAFSLRYRSAISDADTAKTLISDRGSGKWSGSCEKHVFERNQQWSMFIRYHTTINKHDVGGFHSRWNILMQNRAKTKPKKVNASERQKPQIGKEQISVATVCSVYL